MPSIKPEILVWAREQAGLTVVDAAKKLQLRDTVTATAEEKLLSYEQGKAPSRPLLLKMSKQYRTPLLTFYLGAPPTKADRGEDFRTLPDVPDPLTNSLIDSLVRDVKARQSLLKEMLHDDEDAQPLPFIGSMTPQLDPQRAAQDITQAFEFDLEEFRSYRKTVADAFKYLRGLIEDKGIFTLLIGNLGSHHTKLDTSLFRGFVVADDIAPLIVINDQDAKSAWSFTLLHELVHLWLGRTGISGAHGDNQIEKFCNNVASEILLPNTELKAFKPPTHDFDKLAHAISEFASGRNISSTLIVYRLFKEGRYDESEFKKLTAHFRKLWQDEKDRMKAKAKQTDGGPNYYVVRRNRLGNALLNVTERMMLTGSLSATQAGFLLGVRPLKVHKLIGMG